MRIDSPQFYRWRSVGFYVLGPALVVAWVKGWIEEGWLIAITLLISFFTQGATDAGTYRTEQLKRSKQGQGAGDSDPEGDASVGVREE